MKNRKIFIFITALSAAILGLSSCINYMDTADNYGVIRINLGSSGERLAVTDTEKENMTYTVTLKSDGQEDITDKFNGVARIIEVPVGIWSVKIEAEGERSDIKYRALKGSGETTGVEVIAEEITPVEIIMTTTATRVYTWDDLCNDLADAGLPNLEYIEIAGNMTATKTAESRGTIRNILRADKDVVITRGRDWKDPLFKIRNSLTLTGKITLDGNKDNGSTSALFNVEGGGHLTIRDEVTLRNNFSIDGGGVYVQRGGEFTMTGGTIWGNVAGRGGGVFVEANGQFYKTGGVIYGINSGSLSNQANAGGHAVYINGGIGWDETLSREENWPR
jgi:hypothetical protein